MTDGSWAGSAAINGCQQMALMNTGSEDGALLDAGSMFNLFKDESRVINIRPAARPLQMITNAGTKTLDTIADVPGHGTVWFNKEGIANLFSLSSLTKTHRITYDSDNGDAFIATHRQTGKIVIFSRTPDGLYKCKFSEHYLKDQRPLHAQTVKKNIEGFSDREVERARHACSLFHILGGGDTAQFYKDDTSWFCFELSSDCTGHQECGQDVWSAILYSAR